MRRPSNLKSAFSETPNLVGVATLVAASAAMLNPLPLLVGLAAEAGYLLFAPDSKWYNRLLETRYQTEVDRRREELKKKVFPLMSQAEQVRFMRLEENRASIQPTEAERPYLRDVLRKLDYLLEKFLLFAGKRHEFQNYLKNVREEILADAPPLFELPSSGGGGGKKSKPPIVGMPKSDDPAQLDAWAKQVVQDVQAYYADESDRLTKQTVVEENLHNQALIEKRIEIIGRRSQYVQRIAEIFSNLTHQMQLMEDTFGLISDEIRARSPEQVLAEIDGVVNQSDRLSDALQEMSPFDLIPAPDGAEQLYNLQS